MLKEEILVSVIMPVYNHEPYIAQAIEGVLMQRTTFKYELIIGEDCSTDKSREIIREYQKKYPDIIRPVFWKKNVGRYRNGSMLRSLAKGDYWAYCEGDDYWTDELKLQKQVDFLENHNEFSAVYHNVYCVDKIGIKCKRKSINKYPIKEESIYTLDDVKGLNLPGQLAGFMCRNIYKVLGKKDNIHKFEECACNADQKMCIVMAYAGKIFLMGEVMACHRVVLKEGTSWSALMYGKNPMLQNYRFYIERAKMMQSIFGMDCRSKEFETQICKNSIWILKKEQNWNNVSICIGVHMLYFLRQLLEKVDIQGGQA